MNKGIRYIYVLTHVNTGKKYVGKTCNPKNRVMTHMSELLHGTHPNKEMQADFDKYHGDYKFDIVGEAPRYGSHEPEREWMLKRRTYDDRYGYNTKDVMMISVRCENGLPVELGDRWHRGKHGKKVG